MAAFFAMMAEEAEHPGGDMQKYFENCVKEVAACSNQVEARVRVIVGVRLLLQQAVFGLLEWVGNKAPDPSLTPPKYVLDTLWKPADGSLVDALDALLIAAEQTGWSGVSRLLLKSVMDRPAAELCGNHPKNLLGLLRALVQLRNDGGEGHGLLGGYMPAQEADAFKFLVESLQSVLPRADESGGYAKFGTDADVIELKFLKARDGVPALIRRIQRIASDRVRVNCQILDGAGLRADFNYDAPNPFEALGEKGLPSLLEWQNDWGARVSMPDRKTDSFTGRLSQIDELLEWYEDEGARACLVYGDGGFGKTTLAIEFVHRILDQEVEVLWKPKIVIFYTAKRTQWGLNGLEPIKSGQPHLIELLANINVLLFGSYPAAEFYRLDFVAAVSNLQGRMTELGVKRQDVWLVIDNTETLMSDDGESRAVGRELKEVARKIGRVLLTSRRKEHLEATPIEVPVLEMAEAVEFVRERSRKLKCKLAVDAKIEELQREIEKIERRPIVLEAFVSALCDPAIRKIERATERVAKMLNKDLGDFLFADVWARLELKERRVLLLMARVADVHQSYSLRVCCEEAGVTVSSMEQVLEESRGIASVVTVSGDVQIGFTKNFIDFSKGKQVLLPGGSASPTEAEVAKVAAKISSLVKTVSRYKVGTGDEAFRTPLAKAAEMARREGDIVESQRLFEQAVASDSLNGHLRERFAYFLFSAKQDIDAALHQAKIAVELLPDQGEAWFMRGLIEARQGDVRACDASLAKAEDLGVSWYRCSVQKCWGYLKARPPQLPLATKELLRLDTYLRSKDSDRRVSGEVELLKRRLQTISERKVGEVVPRKAAPKKRGSDRA